MTAAVDQCLMTGSLEDACDGAVFARADVQRWLAEFVLPRSVHHGCVDHPEACAADLLSRIESPGCLLLRTVGVGALRAVFNVRDWGVSRCERMLDEGRVAPPLLVTSAGTVVDGTHRYRAATGRGHATIRALIAVPRPAEILCMSAPDVSRAAALLGDDAEQAIRQAQGGLLTYFNGMDTEQLLSAALQALNDAR